MSKLSKTLTPARAGSVLSSLAQTSTPQAFQVLTLEVFQQTIQNLNIGFNAKFDEVNRKMEKRMEEMEEKMQSIIETITVQNKQMGERTKVALQCFADNIEVADQKVEETKNYAEDVDNRVYEVKIRMEKTEGDVTMIQYRDMEFAEEVDNRVHEVKTGLEKMEGDVTIAQYRDMEFDFRYWGGNGKKQQDLAEKIFRALVEYINKQEKDLAWNMDKLCRTNFGVVRQKQLPRDGVG